MTSLIKFNSYDYESYNYTEHTGSSLGISNTLAVGIKESNILVSIPLVGSSSFELIRREVINAARGYIASIAVSKKTPLAASFVNSYTESFLDIYRFNNRLNDITYYRDHDVAQYLSHSAISRDESRYAALYIGKDQEIYLAVYLSESSEISKKLSLKLPITLEEAIETSIAFSGDQILVANPLSNNSEGSVEVYSPYGTLLDTITHPYGVKGFGKAIAANDEIVAVSLFSVANNRPGQVFIYDKDFKYIKDISAFEGEGHSQDGFGISLDMSESNLIIGSPGYGANNQGAAIITTLDNVDSDIKIIKHSSQSPHSNYGCKVSISDNSRVAAVQSDLGLHIHNLWSDQEYARNESSQEVSET